MIAPRMPQLDPLRDELFPSEQARITALQVERETSSTSGCA
jgi:hypothetical protein